MNSNIGLWAKQIQGAIGAGGLALVTALQDGHVSLAEGLGVAVTVLVAFGAITFVKNASSGPLYWAKAITAAVVALIGAFGTAVVGVHWPPTSTQWVVIIFALLNAVPVAVTPNARTSDPDQFELTP